MAVDVGLDNGDEHRDTEGFLPEPPPPTNPSLPPSTAGEADLLGLWLRERFCLRRNLLLRVRRGELAALLLLTLSERGRRAGEEEQSWPHESLEGRFTGVLFSGEFDRALTSGVPGGAVGVRVGVAIATAGIRLIRELHISYIGGIQVLASITKCMIYCEQKERLFKNTDILKPKFPRINFAMT